MNRSPEALRAAGAERVWIDHDDSERAERADLFAMGLRNGFTLVLLSRSDLGVGREIERFENLAASIGATIEIAEPPAPPERKRPGPKPAFDPSPDQLARCLHYWRGPFKRSEALRQIRDIMGFEVSVAQCNRVLGPRGANADTGETS